MKVKTIALLIIALSLTSCQRGCESVKRKYQASERVYHVKMYSGGKIVFEDTFKGIINNSPESDGCYYFKGDSLIEISGDYTIKSID